MRPLAKLGPSSEMYMVLMPAGAPEPFEVGEIDVDREDLEVIGRRQAGESEDLGGCAAVVELARPDGRCGKGECRRTGDGDRIGAVITRGTALAMVTLAPLMKPLAAEVVVR